MKKAYIRPESRLFAINFTENIALQSGFIDGGNIKYETRPDRPGELFYTGYVEAPVINGPSEDELTFWSDKLFEGGDPFTAYYLMRNCSGH